MATSPEILPLHLPLERGVYRTKLYKGVTRRGIRSDFEDVIVLAPGWIGSSTLHFAASALARQGHDVAVVSHDSTSIFRPNKDRSKHVHFTARAASQATGKKGVIFLAHSNGLQDVHHAVAGAARRQSEKPDDQKLYIVKAIGSAAGAGLSGKHLYGRELIKEGIGTARELRDHPSEELQVVGRSIINFLHRPALSIVEGVGAVYSDLRTYASEAIHAGNLRAYVEMYTKGDGVVPRPEDRNDFELADGSHLTPVVSGDIMVEISQKLYQDNNAKTLQIASYGRLAA